MNMPMQYNVIDQIGLSMNSLWFDVMQFLPMLVVALVVVIAGWVIGAALKQVVIRIFGTLRVNAALEAAGVDTLAARAGYKLDAGAFVGSLVKWFVIVVFFVAALDILQLNEVTVFLREVVLAYVPKGLV